MRRQCDMKIKLVALDMDGTLMNSKSLLSQGNQAVLEKAMKAGIYIVPATGRVYSTLPEAVKNLPGVKYVLSSNGAAVYRVGEASPIYTNFMSKQKALEIFHAIEGVSCIKEFYVEGYGYFEQSILQKIDTFDIPEAFRQFYGIQKKTVESIQTLLQSDIKGVEKINLPWITAQTRAELLKCLSSIEGIALTSSIGQNIEINRKGANKGDGLKGLCDVIGLDMSQVMAIGDSANDLEMIQEAGWGVAMANGEKQIKEIADFITLSNDEDGVGYAIEKFCFGK